MGKQRLYHYPLKNDDDCRLRLLGLKLLGCPPSWNTSLAWPDWSCSCSSGGGRGLAGRIGRHQDTIQIHLMREMHRISDTFEHKLGQIFQIDYRFLFERMFKMCWLTHFIETKSYFLINSTWKNATKSTPNLNM